MRKFSMWSAIALIAIPFTAPFTAPFAEAAGDDCELGARYYQLSETATSEYRSEDAFLFLERAAKACPSYKYFQEMAEVATEFGDPQRNQLAAEALGSALELATTDMESARSIARYAELLFHGSDPQNAMTYIVEARNLDPNSQWIADLSDEITNRAANVTTEDIKRGLADMAFKPLRLNRSLPQDKVLAAGGGGSGSSTEAAVADAPVEQALAPRSVNIPLNFQVNSTILDGATQNNLNVLADTLILDAFDGQQFMLVGHADVRGDAASNLALSIQRANAIYEAIKVLQPALAGRIVAGGKGEQEPMATGLTEADHYINRRLEVILVQ
jgi:outer membrane protein OmpA-like peptidoglycan-associated protein